MADFLYPLPKEYYDQTTTDSAATAYYNRSYHGAHTYGGHGTGKLDLNCSNGTPVRSMTDGIVIRAGKDNNSSYRSMQILVQGESSPYTMENQGYIGEGGVIGGTLIIRYYHIGDYQFSVGDRVKQGDIIGYVGDSAVSSGPHLHLDFATSISGSLMPAYGLLQGAPSPESISSFSEEQKAALARWYRDEKKPGRCWEVIISDAAWKEPSKITGNLDPRMNVASAFKSENDWLALYGMLQYEESVCAKYIGQDEVDTAVCEWVVRVFRNRIFSGSSIASICQWDSGKPGYSAAVNKGEQLNSNARDFCKKIMEGYNYFAVEKVAEKNIFGSWPDKNHWYDRLYAACTFYGGYPPRWPNNTLAAVPFRHGTFCMEGEYNTATKKKFWPNGVSGRSAYPSPYI